MKLDFLAEAEKNYNTWKEESMPAELKKAIDEARDMVNQIHACGVTIELNDVLPKDTKNIGAHVLQKEMIKWENTLADLCEMQKELESESKERRHNENSI